MKVNGIQVVEKPELDDDFASDVSDFDTFAEYKADVVKRLTERVEKNNENAAKNALVEKAVENAQVDIPQPMIEAQCDYMIREMEMNAAYQGIRLDDYLKYMGMTREALKAQNEPEAVRRVKNELVIEAIRKAEGIEPTEEDIEKQIAEQAERYGEDPEKFKANLTEQQKEYLKDDAAISLVLDLLMKDAVFHVKVNGIQVVGPRSPRRKRLPRRRKSPRSPRPGRGRRRLRKRIRRPKKPRRNNSSAKETEILEWRRQAPFSNPGKYSGTGGTERGTAPAIRFITGFGKEKGLCR